jgi:hypothetical protein
VAKTDDRFGPAFQKSHPKIAQYFRNHPNLKLKWNSEGVQKARRALEKHKRKRHKNNPKKPTDIDSAAPWQVLYGTVRTGGTITFKHISENEQFYYLVITLAGHEIDAVEAIHFGKQTINFAGSLVDGAEPPVGSKWRGYVFAELRRGTETQTALTQLREDLPSKWDATKHQYGCAHIYLRLKHKEELFPQGLPEITFTIRGKPVFDPRTDTRYFTNNAALCAHDFLSDTRFGCGVVSEEIDLPNIGWAADICGETMPEPAGSSTPAGIRYSVDGILDSDDSPQDVLEMMAGAMGGSIMMTGGVWRIQPGVWIGPAVTIDANDFMGELNIRTRLSRRDSFNGVRGTYIDKKFDYEEGDFPQVTSNLYVTQDASYELWDDITLPLTTHSTTAQRLAKLHLERIRQPMTITARLHPRILQLTPIDTVLVNYARLGWTNRAFEILEMSPEIQDSEGGPILGAVCTLKETAAGVFDWAEGEATVVDFAPETDLPDAFAAEPPTDLTLESGNTTYYVRSDGTVAPRIRASWVAPTGTLVTGGGHYEVEYKRSSDAWTDANNEIVSSSVTSALLADVQSGVTYDVRVRTVNALGAASTWLELDSHTVVGKTLPPSDVTGFTIVKEQSGNRFNWDPIPDLDLSEYEIRRGASWAAGAWFLDTRSTDFFWSLRTAGAYEFWLKAIDTSGNYSLNASYASLTIANPSVPPTINYAIEGDTVVVSWTSSTSDYPIEDYAIWIGDDFVSATFLATTKGTSFRTKANWAGWKNIYVIARDIAGNASSSGGFVTVTLSPPNPVQSLVGNNVDNNVILDWNQPVAGVLEIARYKIYKGSTFATATFLGSFDGTFATYIETSGGNYTYWVVAVDLAGHESTEQGVAVTVYNPPDYVLKAIDTLHPTYGGLTWANQSVLVQGDVYSESATSMLAPVSTLQTYTQHFTNNSKTTFQDFITAGFAKLAQPINTSGAARMRWKVDYGAVLPESAINVSFTKTDIAGSCSIITNIQYSSDDVSYTSVDASRVFAQNFRYVKVTLDITPSDNKSFCRIDNVTAKLDVKKQTDSGTATISSSDIPGTVVYFNVPFLDVTSIVGTLQGTTKCTWIIDFTDVANPTSFKVLAWDLTTGNRIGGDFRWTAEGVINVI